MLKNCITIQNISLKNNKLEMKGVKKSEYRMTFITYNLKHKKYTK